MHARLFNGRERLDRPLQLAFQRTVEIEVLGEFGGAQIGLVEQFVADPPRSG